MLDVFGWIRIHWLMIATRLRCPGVCLFFIVWSLGALHAKTEVFFSPGGLIKDKIIRNIDSSEKSIDVAALLFSSGEIAEALYKAKERGVKIRIILDYRQKQKRHPLVEFLKNEGFSLEFLKADIGGFMNNTFAIFDSKILVTGSYSWSEYSEKFNYENVLFVDESDVVKKFQQEFESLYEKSMVKKAVVDDESDTFELASSDETVTDNNSEDHGNERLSISFQEFDGLFGKEGKLNRVEKIRLWKDQFEGRYVKWTGTIGYKGIAVYDWNKIGIIHKRRDIDVQLRFDWTKKRKLMNLVIGDVITYTGKLVSPGGFMAPCRIDNADVLDIRR